MGLFMEVFEHGSDILEDDQKAEEMFTAVIPSKCQNDSHLETFSFLVYHCVT